MRFGLNVANFGYLGDVRTQLEILTLDALSGGRFIFGAGNGLLAEEFEHLGDEGDLRVRSQMPEVWLDRDGLGQTPRIEDQSRRKKSDADLR